MSNKVVHALYDDDDVLLSAVKNIRKEKYNIEEVYTPFPVHGLDKAMGLENASCYNGIYLWMYWFNSCNGHDEIYYD